MPRGRRGRGGAKRAAAQELLEEAQPDGLELSAGTLEVDFDFNQLTESDFHAVSTLLKGETWAFMKDLDFSELSDCICEQGNIGTAVRTNVVENQDGACAQESFSAKGDDDEMIVGLVTVMNLRQFADKSWPKAIEKALVARAKKNASPELLKSLENLLSRREEKAEVGLLINERAVNLPDECVLPMHKALLDDIDWSCTTPECPDDERPFYFFSHFIGIARCGPPQAERDEVEDSEGADDEEEPASERSKKRRRKGKAAVGACASTKELAFQYFEDECFVKRSLFSFSFPMPAPKGDRAFTYEKRMVYAITRSAYQEVVGELEEARGKAGGDSKSDGNQAPQASSVDAPAAKKGKRKRKAAVA